MTNFLYLDVDECEDPNKCHQHCLNTNGSYICGCNDGFVLQSDAKSCKIISKLSFSFSFLLSLYIIENILKKRVSDETGIRLLMVRGSSMEWVSPTSSDLGLVNLGPNMRYLTAFDVHNQTNTYFWADIASNTIYSRKSGAQNYTKVSQK